MNPDPPPVPTEPNLPVQGPTLTPRLKFLLAITGLLVLIIAITIAIRYLPNLLNPSKPTPIPTSATPSTSVNPFPLEKVIIGLISEINPESLIVKESSDQKTTIFINDQTKIRIQKIIPPTKEEERATGSAKLIGRIQGNTPATLQDLKVGDEIRITLEEKDNQFWAKIITVTRQVKK